MAGCNERLHPSEEIHPLTPTTAFERWGLDFIGHLPETENGNKWIIVAVDYATKWPIAKAFKQATAKETANFLFENILMEFGCPSEIITERGSQCMSEVFEGYFDLQKIKHLGSSAYHPRTNGMVERLNGLIKKMMTTYVVNHTNKWDSFISQILFACRIRVHCAKKFSPFKLIYGCDPKIPGDPVKPYLFKNENEEDVLAFRIHELEDLGQIRAAALQRAHLNALRMKRNYEIKV